jgi:hypothetical protein
MGGVMYRHSGMFGNRATHHPPTAACDGGRDADLARRAAKARLVSGGSDGHKPMTTRARK